MHRFRFFRARVICIGLRPIRPVCCMVKNEVPYGVCIGLRPILYHIVRFAMPSVASVVMRSCVGGT